MDPAAPCPLACPETLAPSSAGSPAGSPAGSRQGSRPASRTASPLERRALGVPVTSYEEAARVAAFADSRAPPVAFAGPDRPWAPVAAARVATPEGFVDAVTIGGRAVTPAEFAALRGPGGAPGIEVRYAHPRPRRPASSS